MNNLIDGVFGAIEWVESWFNPQASVQAPELGANKPKTLDKYGRAFKGIKQDVAKGDYTKLNTLLNQFAAGNVANPWVQESPQFCAKLIPIMGRELKLGNLQREQVAQVIKLFCKTGVFKAVPRHENVAIRAKDGVVFFNKMLLSVQNNYFQTLFSSPMQKQEAGKLQIDMSAYATREALEFLKSYFHSQEILQYDDSELLVLLQDLARMIGEEPLLSDINNQIKRKIETSSFAVLRMSPDDLFRELFALSNRLEGAETDDVIEKMRLGIVERYLRTNQQNSCKISHDKKYLLLQGSAVTHLETGNDVALHIQRYVKGFMINNVTEYEQILFFMFDPKVAEFNKGVKELTLEKEVSSSIDFSKLADAFPNVERMTIRFNTLDSMPWTSERRLDERRSMFVNNWSWLSKVNHFKKLTSLEVVASDNSSAGTYIELSKEVMEQLKNLQSLQFKQPGGNPYLSYWTLLYAPSLKKADKDAFVADIQSLPWIQQHYRVEDSLASAPAWVEKLTRTDLFVRLFIK